jgi:hypothetical protein
MEFPEAGFEFPKAEMNSPALHLSFLQAGTSFPRLN